jgi:tripartite-type tricarboxylate transporter receptor subunit TctC
MTFDRRAFLQLAGAGLASPAVSSPSWAQAWPMRPIHAVVPLVAGTGVDVLSRLVLNELSVGLGQPVVVDNRPGASGTTGGAIVAKADADGYTILTDSSSHTIIPSLFPNLPYDPVADLAPVVALGSMPFVLVCAQSKGFNTLQDLVAAAKANPGKLNYATAGLGTTNHLATERLQLSAGFQATHVPYKGAGFITDVLSGRIDFAVIPLGPYIQSIKDGQLVALAVASSKHTALLPNVPTTVDAGYADSSTNFWVGLFAPVKTPRSILERLHDETLKGLDHPGVREKLAQIAAEPMPLSMAEFESMITGEFKSNQELAKSIGLKAT